MGHPENIDIDEARQQEILDLEAKVSSPNHFEVLGLPAGAGAEDVKKAFHEASKKFHPDRYFGKNLGTFKGRLERIFRRLVEAQSVLSDPAKRQAYLDASPFIRAAIRQQSSGSGSGLFSAGGTTKSGDEVRRDAERQARLARHPYLAKGNRTRDLLSRARAAIAVGEFSHAFTHLNQASQADPNNAEVRALLSDVRQKNEQLRADASFKAGKEALNRSDEVAAITAFKTAVAASATHHEAAYQAALLLSRHKAHPREVVGYAQKAVEAAPTNVDYRILLAVHLEAAGMSSLAKRHFEEASKLAPDHPDLKKHVKKRWPF